MSYVSGWWPYPVTEWRGVRLYRRHSLTTGEDGSPIIEHRPVADGGKSASDFSKFFHAILPRFRDYAWIFYPESFNTLLLSDEEAERMSELLEGLKISEAQCYAALPGFLEEWAVAVRDDWNRIIGFRKPFSDQTVLRGEDTPIDPKIIASADVLFDNYDGAYWACYSPHTSIIEQVLSSNANRPDLLVVSCSFRETYERHKAEWDEWEKKFLKSD